MILKTFPYNYNALYDFPGATALKYSEGGAVYVARENGKPVVIIDSGTLADFVDDADPVLDVLVKVIWFDSDEEYNDWKVSQGIMIV